MRREGGATLAVSYKTLINSPATCQQMGQASALAAVVTVSGGCGCGTAAARSSCGVGTASTASTVREWIF